MTVDISGTTVSCEMRGQTGPKVVLLHGWGCDGGMMAPVAAALAEDHRVLSVDFPGHGKSGRPPRPWGVPEYGGCLRALLEKLDFLPCDVVAHSFGGRVAVWLAAEHPEMFGKLVLTGAAGLKAPPTEASRKRSEAYRKGKAWAEKIGKIPGLNRVGADMKERLVQKYGSADYRALDEEMRKTFVKVIGQDLADCYPRVKQSTLLIWGEKDTETPLWMGRKMEELIPDAGLVVFEGGTHFAWLEQVGRFNTIIRNFL